MKQPQLFQQQQKRFFLLQLPKNQQCSIILKNAKIKPIFRTIQATKFSTTTTKNIATTTTTPESTTTVRKHDPPPADIPNLEEFVHKQTTKRPNLKLVRLEKFVDFDSWRAKPANDFIGDVPKAKPDLQGFGVSFSMI